MKDVFKYKPPLRWCMDKISQTLTSIGLTDSEAKVYLGLLKLGLSSKIAIQNESKIAHSKVYDVLNKLINKGLTSIVIIGKVRHYKAAPLSRIKDYLSQKKNEIEKQEKEINSIFPLLASLQQSIQKDSVPEVFKGWEGLETAYDVIYKEMKSGDKGYILGASKGTNISRSKLFFHRQSRRVIQAKFNIKFIFNENSRKYVSDMEQEEGITYHKRFMKKTTCVEIIAAKNFSMIVILKQEPIAILMRDLETARSFIIYFEELWKVAKN